MEDNIDEENLEILDNSTSENLIDEVISSNNIESVKTINEAENLD